MSIRTIKDPTFNIYAKGGNVENRNKPIKKEQLLQLAKDEADIIFDLENDIISTLRNEFEKEKSKGQTFSDWLKSKDIEELKRIELSNGGTAESYADLIDAYEKNIDVMPGESLTEYIKRVRATEAKEGN